MANKTTRKWTEKVWTEAHARRVLDARERSGLSIRAFAAREGLGPERLYWWTKRLARGVRRGGNAEGAATSFVPAVVKVARPALSRNGGKRFSGLRERGRGRRER